MIPYWTSPDGRHVIYCGDCLTVLPHLTGVDALICDPPYRHAHMDGGGFASARKFYAGGAIDFVSDFDFRSHSDALFCAPILVAFCSRDLIRDYSIAADANGFTFDLHAWHKTNAIPFCCNTFKSDLEYIVVAWKGEKNLAALPQHELSKLWQSGIHAPADKSHPTEKPVDLMRKYIRAFGQAETICDPFMGSGTTGVACVKLGRKFIGIEISREYCDIAVKRMDRELSQPHLPGLEPHKVEQWTMFENK